MLVGWANQNCHEDEDLLPEPGSPELSEDEEVERDEGGGDIDEPGFLSEEDEVPTHVEISVRD